MQSRDSSNDTTLGPPSLLSFYNTFKNYNISSYIYSESNFVAPRQAKKQILKCGKRFIYFFDTSECELNYSFGLPHNSLHCGETTSSVDSPPF
jgi:hypothetical protein